MDGPSKAPYWNALHGLLWSGCYSAWNTFCCPGSRGDLLSLMGRLNNHRTAMTSIEKVSPISEALIYEKPASLCYALTMPPQKDIPFLRPEVCSHHEPVAHCPCPEKRKIGFDHCENTRVRFRVRERLSPPSLSPPSLSPSPSMMRSPLPIQA